MRERPSSLKQGRVLAVVGVLAVIFIIWMVAYFPDFARLRSLRKANAKLHSDIARLETEIEELKGKIKKVGDDPLIYEKVAREELGVVKEDEIVVDIEE